MAEQRKFEAETFRIDVSEDGLLAELHVSAGGAVPVNDVIDAIKTLKIQGTDEKALTESLKAALNKKVTLTIAKGTPVVDEKPAKVELRVPLATAENGLVVKTSAGQVIGDVTPPTPGKEGRDVFGNALPFGKAIFSAGHGIKLLKGNLVTTIAGNLRETDGIVNVHPLLEVYATDDAQTPMVDFKGDVSIKGSLVDGRSLVAAGSLVVGGAVEAAQFRVGAWVFVKGGIIGRDRGHGIVEGDLHVRYATTALLTVGGNVSVQSEIANCRLSCGGKLSVAGPIWGGEITANGGISCKSIGNSSGTTTVIEVGSDLTLRALLLEFRPELEANRKRIAQIREKVAPLMKCLKQLTAQQKEKATELLYEADELEEQNEEKIEALIERCRAAHGKATATIEVAETIYPGTVLRLPGQEVVITTAFMGPLTVEMRVTGNLKEVILREQGGDGFALQSKPITDHFGPFMKQLLSLKKAA